jgi:hypothetical protein
MTQEKTKGSTWELKIIIKSRKKVKLWLKSGDNRRMGKIHSEVIHNFVISSGTTGERTMGLQNL